MSASAPIRSAICDSEWPPVVTVSGFVPLQPGVYWLTLAAQVQQPTVRGHANAQPNAAYPPIMYSATPTGSSAIAAVGRTVTGVTGALASAYPAGSTEASGAMPVLFAQFDVPDRD